MIRKVKALGLALVAIFAMGAMMASAASANSFITDGTSFTGDQDGGLHQFFVTGQEVTCTGAAFGGSAGAAPIEKAESYAAYTGCKAEPLGISATVTGFATSTGQIGEAGKCWYILKADTSVRLECNGGEVTVDAGPCIVHVPEQDFPTGSVSYTNIPGTPDDITMDIHVQKVTATHTDGFLCPFSSSGVSSSATLIGKSTVKAFDGPVQEDITWDDTK